jgi:putative ABC transport system permease protein
MTDLKYALRLLLKRPAFTALAVATLAIGIGANAAIFSVVYGVLLRPLPYPRPEEIVRLWEHTSRSARVNVSGPNLRDWHDRLKSFEALAGYEQDTTTVLGGTNPAFADVYAVTKDFFDLFRVRPALGRTFVGDELSTGGPFVVVVSDRFWKGTLGANADLDGLHLKLEGLSARVIGVMPPGFDFPAGADIWMPHEHWADNSGRTAHNYRVIGRLKASRDAADAELRVIAAQLRSEHPGDDDAQGITMVTLQDAVTGGTRPLLLLLMSAVALVLLIACVNVATTMLARGEERRTEIAVRAALGAGRARIARQLMIESLLLGILGATTGIFLGAWLLRAFLAMNTLSLGGQAVTLDGWVVAFTAALGVATPLIFGALPALQLSRPNLRHAIVEGGRGSMTPVRRSVRDVLVGAEAAIALMLLIGASLLVHSFWRLLSIDPGFDAHGVVALQAVVPQNKYPTPDASARFYQQLLDRIRSVPGIEAAGATTAPPLSGGGPSGTFVFEGGREVVNAALVADYFVISSGYFAAMHTPIVRGRGIEDQDRAGTDTVVVVNQEFVRKYLPGENPIGRRFRYLGMDSRNEPMMTIVGVVADVRNDSLASPVVPEAYVSYLQRPNRTRSPVLVAARAGQPEAVGSLMTTIRAIVSATDPDVPVKLTTMESRVAESVADRRFAMAVLSAFAIVALLLAAVGIYGVLSQSIVQRTAEIGVRMALGAEAFSVVQMVIETAMRPVLAGIGCGLLAAAFAVRVLQGLLFGVAPLDPSAFIAAPLALVVVALVAAFVPARRATRIDPLAALRST